MRSESNLYPLYFNEYAVLVPTKRMWNIDTIAAIINDGILKIASFLLIILSVLWLPSHVFQLGNIRSYRASFLIASLLTTIVSVVFFVFLVRQFIGSDRVKLPSIDDALHQQLPDLNVLIDVQLYENQWLRERL